MEKIYADLIIKGEKDITDVPEKKGIREKTRQILIERGYPEMTE